MNPESTTEKPWALKPNKQAPAMPQPNPKGRRRWRLDTKETIAQILQNLPYDCYQNTCTGFCFSTRGPLGTTYRHARCNQLTCRSCAKQFRNRAYRLLRQAFKDRQITHFLTLTLPGKTKPHDQPRILRTALKRFLQDAKRTFGPFAYIWVIGVDKRDHHHIHLVTSQDLSHARRYSKRVLWAKSKWHSLTGAIQTKSLPITHGTEANIVDYLLFNIFQTVIRGHKCHRRYGCSRGIRFRPSFERDPLSKTWQRHSQPAAVYARQLGVEQNPQVNSGFIVLDDANASSGPCRIAPVAPGAPQA